MAKNHLFFRKPLLLLLLIAAGTQPRTRLSAEENTSIVERKSASDARHAKSEELQYPGKTLRDGVLSLANRYESAILADPTSVANHVGLADAYIMYWCFGFAPRDEVLPKIRLAARKAVEMDGQDASARTALGIAKLSQWDWSGAEKELATAVRLNPDRAQSHHWYALALAARGRHRDAIRESEQAATLDPSAGMQTGMGAVLYFARDWNRLIGQMRATINIDPDFAPAYDWLGMAYVQEERYDESIAAYEKAVDLSEGLAEIVAGLGHAYALAGKEQQARTVLEKLRRLDERWYVPPVQIAYVLVGLGEHDEAFRLLDRAYAEHSWELVFMKEEPWFDPLRSDPRFEQLEGKLNFPE